MIVGRSRPVSGRCGSGVVRHAGSFFHAGGILTGCCERDAGPAVEPAAHAWISSGCPGRAMQSEREPVNAREGEIDRASVDGGCYRTAS